MMRAARARTESGIFTPSAARGGQVEHQLELVGELDRNRRRLGAGKDAHAHLGHAPRDLGHVAAEGKQVSRLGLLRVGADAGQSQAREPLLDLVAVSARIPGKPGS
jgi:hypothetical protein